MYHSIIILVDGQYIDTWDDWHLIPSSRPVIAPPKERTSFVTVGGRSGVLDFSQTLAGKATFDDRTGSIEFYVENDYWDWETAYTTICEALQGKRVKLALEDNPAHYYEGLLYVDKWTSDKGHSKISLKYDLHPDMQTLPLESMEFVETELTMTPGMVTDLHLKVLPTNTFYRKVTITSWPAGIAEVTTDGLVRAIQNGVTELRAVCGPLKAVCRVSVQSGTFWNVTWKLNGCTMTNHANKIQNGRKYENTLTAPDGYVLTSVLIFNSSGVREGTIAPQADGKTAQISIPSVTGTIQIVAEVQEQPFVSVTWKLDCVNAVNPVTKVQKGRRENFKIESVTPYYLLDTVTIRMNGYEQSDCIAWNGLTEATITLPVNGDIVITATAKARFTLEECSWALIDRIARSGRGAEFFKVGDTKTIVTDTRIASNTLLDKNSDALVSGSYSNKYHAVILGFNHNPTVEGAASIHFCIGRNKEAWEYLVTNSAMNTGSATNSNGASNSPLMAMVNYRVLQDLPSALTQVMRKSPKTVYDTKKQTMVTEELYLWLLSEKEVFGTTSRCYAKEAESQMQYSYFSKEENRNGATWLRSPARDTQSFCKVIRRGTQYSDSTGNTYYKYTGACDSGWATDKMNALLCFSLGSKTTAVLDKTILDKSVLG